jgi:hypothetical protein
MEIRQGLDFVMKLHPVEYQTITDLRTSFGFIAQDIEAILGDEYAIINVNNDDERTLSLRITDLIAPMVKAVQEQQAIIENQKNKIDNQQKQIDELLLRMSKLEMVVAR